MGQPWGPFAGLGLVRGAAKVGVDSTGIATAVVLGRQPGASYDQIFYSRRPAGAGGQWTPWAFVSGPGYPGGLQLGVDPSGFATIVYGATVSCGAGCSIPAILSQTLPPGQNAAWSAPMNLSGTTIIAGGPRLAVGPNGKAAVVWTESLFYGCCSWNGVAARTRSSRLASSWTPKQTLTCLAPGCGQNNDYPQVAISPNPADTWVKATAVWQQAPEREGAAREGEKVWVASASTGPTGVFGSHTQIETGTLTAFRPIAVPVRAHVAMDAAGNAIAVWESENAVFHTAPDGYTYYTVSSVHLNSARRSSAGWGAPATLSGGWIPDGTASPVSLAMNARGDAAAAWLNQTSGQLYATTRKAGAASWDPTQWIAYGGIIPGGDAVSLVIDAAGVPTLGWAGESGISRESGAFTSRPAAGTPPSASFTASAGARAGRPVTLTSTSVARQGSLVKIQWDLPNAQSDTNLAGTFISDGYFDDSLVNPAKWTPPPSGHSHYYRVVVRVFDSNGNWSTHNQIIDALPPAITIGPPVLPDGKVGTQYLQAFSATGGNFGDNYTFALTGGKLPPGVSVGGGYVGGTPTASGTASFTITATDAQPPYDGATGTKSYTLKINP